MNILSRTVILITDTTREETYGMVDTARRAEELGLYIVKNNATVRAAAKAFGVSKSTVHTDITEKLQNVNSDLWQDVRKVLDVNKAQRHLRGGQATKEKYLREKR